MRRQVVWKQQGALWALERFGCPSKAGQVVGSAGVMPELPEALTAWAFSGRRWIQGRVEADIIGSVGRCDLRQPVKLC